MSDTLMTIIAIFAAVIIMFIFPLMWTANSQEEISQTTVQTLVSNFVNTIASKGKLTRTDYEDFYQKLHATGSTFDIEIEIQVLDDNPGKKTTISSPNLIGENIYYSIFTSTLLYSEDGIYGSQGEEEYLLKKGDYVIVNVKNTNITLASQLKNFLYKIIGDNTHTIAASATALIINNGTRGSI